MLRCSLARAVLARLRLVRRCSLVSGSCGGACSSRSCGGARSLVSLVRRCSSRSCGGACASRSSRCEARCVACSCGTGACTGWVPARRAGARRSTLISDPFGESLYIYYIYCIYNIYPPPPPRHPEPAALPGHISFVSLRVDKQNDKSLFRFLSLFRTVWTYL